MKVAASPRVYGAMPEGSIQVTSYKKKPCHQKDGMAFRMVRPAAHVSNR